MTYTLFRHVMRLAWAANFAAWAFVITLLLGGCAQLREDLRSGIRPGLPCEANTCTTDQLRAQDRDPIGDLLTPSAVMGAPQDGPVTVQP